MTNKFIDIILNKHDSILLSTPENKFYLASLYSGSGYVLLTKEKTYVFVDSRYYSEMKQKHNNVLNLDKIDFKTTLDGIIKENNLKSMAFEKEISYATYEKLKNIISIAFVPEDLSGIRQIKSEKEISQIKSAAEIADKAFASILDYIKVGMKESEVANKLVYYMKSFGAQKESFDTIVASGNRSAYPHAKASDKIISPGDFVLIDFGAIYNNYCSDMTRTIIIDGEYDKKLKQIYDVVLEAQLSAISNIKPGAICSSIDKTARDIIQMHGFGEYFLHNLGHSIGIKCHEEPRFSPSDSTVLEPGMILTVEPGIYIEGIGGVRIEDDVLVTTTGYEVLTKSDKSFRTIGGK